MAGKQPQKTPPRKHAPPHVADGPPDTPEGCRRYDGKSLSDSADYADRRSREAAKPYTAETEAAPARADDAGKTPPPPSRDDPVPQHPEATGRSPPGDRSCH
jgi:hypothetical protein